MDRLSNTLAGMAAGAVGTMALDVASYTDLVTTPLADRPGLLATWQPCGMARAARGAPHGLHPPARTAPGRAGGAPIRPFASRRARWVSGGGGTGPFLLMPEGRGPLAPSG